jgi:hypothetical protein
MMNLLQIVQEVCRRQGINQPSTVVANSDTTVQQLLGFANEVVDEVVTRYGWQAVQIPVTFVAVNQLQQFNVYTQFPGFKWIVPETFWDMTARIPVGGPMSDEDWERALALPFTGPFYRYRIFQNNLQLFPAPPGAGSQHTFALEYQSQAMIQQAGTPATYSQYWTADTDTPLIPDRLFILGLRWRWRSEKGLPYSEHHRTYEMALNDLAGHDGGKRKLDIADGAGDAIRPGVWVPAGNWNLTNGSDGPAT